MTASPQRLLFLLPCAVTIAAGVAALAGAALLTTTPGPALALLLAGQLLDMLDGWLARRLGAVSKIGRELDWSSDVAIVHVLLGWLGAFWAVLPCIVLQAASLRCGRRCSGRTLVVAVVVYATLRGFHG